MLASADGLPPELLGARVVVASVPPSLPGSRAMRVNDGVRLLATGTAVLLEDGYVRLLVLGTDEVRLEARPGLPVAALEPYVYGFAARIVLLHSGVFTLHASVVSGIGGSTGAIAIGGDSGAGKSTTAVALARGGGRLVVDDVAPVRLDGDRVVVEPFARPVHLSAERVERWRVENAVPLDPARPRAGKLAADLAEPAGPLTLDRIAVLRVTVGMTSPARARAVRGGERLQEVIRLANATGLASLGQRREPFFAWAAGVADRVDVVEVLRDRDVESLPQVVALVAESLPVDGPVR